jgi:hypothetical protein
MEALVREGLYGAGLVPVATPALVDRYNRCLSDIGIAPTKLKRFAIDARGWSPQIAEEKGTLAYLSHGDSNPFAIILSPKQAWKPVYYETNSFDREMLGEFFDTFRAAIAHVTAVSALWLDLNQGIDHYHTPLDLLRFDLVQISATSPDRVMQEARLQAEQVRHFLADGWRDNLQRAELLRSVQRWGDMRNRDYAVGPHEFRRVRNFHSRAFGGVFLFRELPRNIGAFFVAPREVAIELRKKHKAVGSIESRKLLPLLVEMGLLRASADFHRSNPRFLLGVRRFLFVRTVAEADPAQPLVDLTSAQEKALVHRYREQLPEAYFELEEIAYKLKNEPNEKLRPSSGAWRYLLQPAPGLNAMDQALAWRLYAENLPANPETLYRYAKPRFYQLYREWPQTLRAWCVRYLRESGFPNAQDDG